MLGISSDNVGAHDREATPFDGGPGVVLVRNRPVRADAVARECPINHSLGTGVRDTWLYEHKSKYGGPQQQENKRDPAGFLHT